MVRQGRPPKIRVELGKEKSDRALSEELNLVDVIVADATDACRRMAGGQQQGKMGGKGSSSTVVAAEPHGGGGVENHLRKERDTPFKGKQVVEERWMPAKRGVRLGDLKKFNRGTKIYVPSRFQPLQGDEMKERLISEIEKGSTSISQLVDI
ncbi:hypothetical protein Dimus_031075 [Dionaea muscipula]